MKSFFFTTICLLLSINGFARECVMTAHDTLTNTYKQSRGKYSPETKSMTIVTLMGNPSVSYEDKIYAYSYNESFGVFSSFYEYENHRYVLNYSLGKTYRPNVEDGFGVISKSRDFYVEYIKPLSDQQYYSQCGCPNRDCLCDLAYPYALKLSVKCEKRKKQGS